MAPPTSPRGPALLLLVVALAIGCESGTSLGPARRWGPTVSAVASSLAAAQSRPKATEKRRHLREPWVFLDGKPVGVVKHSELPVGLEPTMVVRGEPFPLFPLAEYLKRMGADLARIKEVHLIGGQRPAIVSGPELLRVRDKLFFAFTRATSGRPRMDWPSERVEANTKIDIIRAIAVYEERDPPQFDRKLRAFRFADGPPIEGIPYAEDEEARRGVRVYRDGRVSAVIRRKSLPSSVSASEGRYGLRALLEALGVATNDIETASFIDDEDEVLRLESDPLRDGVTLRLLEQKGGAAEVRAGSDASPVRVSAISLHTSH